MLTSLAALLIAACMSAPAPARAPRSLPQQSPAAVVEELLTADRAFSAAGGKTDLIAGLTAMFADSVTVPLSTGQ